MIAILEGDDYWVEEKLEKQIEFFKNKEIVLNWGNCIVVNENGRPINYYRINVKDQRLINDPLGKILEIFAKLENPIWAQTVVIRKNALKKIGGFQGRDYLHLVDYPTWVNLALIGKFSFIAEYLGYWRRHRFSVTINYSKNLENLEGFSKYFLGFYKKNKSKIQLAWNYHQLSILHKKIIKEMRKKITYYNATFLLKTQQYKEARKMFLEVINSDIPFEYKIAAYSGILSTYLKIDLIEVFNKIRGLK